MFGRKNVPYIELARQWQDPAYSKEIRGYKAVGLFALMQALKNARIMRMVELDVARHESKKRRAEIQARCFF